MASLFRFILSWLIEYASNSKAFAPGRFLFSTTGENCQLRYAFIQVQFSPENPKKKCKYFGCRVNGSVHHYRLHYDGAFWVKPDKKFNILIDLVSDGLRVLFMDQQWRLLVTLLQNKLPDDVKRVSFRTTGHEFKRSFIWMRKCSVCGQSGVFANLKCRGNFIVMLLYYYHSGFFLLIVECGVESHERCALSCNEKCHNSGRIFGVELDKLVKLDDSKRPFILEMCIEEIERRGLDAEGLYRVSGFSDEIEALKNAFERGKFRFWVCLKV